MQDRFRKRQIFFAFLFVLGSFLAPVGWYAEWKHLVPILDYAAIIEIIGHAFQVIGAFGSLLTPDFVEKDED